MAHGGVQVTYMWVNRGRLQWIARMQTLRFIRLSEVGTSSHPRFRDMGPWPVKLGLGTWPCAYRRLTAAHTGVGVYGQPPSLEVCACVWIEPHGLTSMSGDVGCRISWHVIGQKWQWADLPSVDPGVKMRRTFSPPARVHCSTIPKSPPDHAEDERLAVSLCIMPTDHCDFKSP